MAGGLYAKSKYSFYQQLVVNIKVWIDKKLYIVASHPIFLHTSIFIKCARVPEGFRHFRKLLKSEVYSKIVYNRDNRTYLNKENGHI